VLVLALDTATPTLVAGLARWSPDGATEVLAERAVPSGNRHAELLTVAVTEVLRDAGLALGDVDAVVTGLGPRARSPGCGSGWSPPRRSPTRAGCPWSASARWTRSGSGARTVVTDARRKEVYWAAYGTDGTRTDGPGVARPEELTVAGPVLGDARFAERLGVEVTPAEVTTTGLVLAAAPQLADPSSAAPLAPLYLRRPDAVPPTSFKPVTTA
jgi:tRNA A37 threonylcarbamoyladenosine modification protein TsaB